MSAEIRFERDELRSIALAGANQNERDLAGCAGHQFARLGPASPYYRCAHCGGVADAAMAKGAA
jgi:hypothetical protein